ncbi:Hap4 transcription factor, heteromerization domain protein [Madurella fahalii]|uniref:Hap4 transcription factor, heteromerization domain protein n=1 Tax=Madurella fahalii TaxID=1157608 RepID=A0ABQ0G9M7_9PEZI
MAVNTAIQGGGPSSGSADAAPLRTLSITTAINLDSPHSATTPTSAPSPSNVSTPTSSCSTAPPVTIRPNTANQPPTIKASGAMDNMASPSAASPASLSQPKTLSMTSKEWVIPPRPKPGRKPATDTPPTKRKAQNRAAQRAFRERRAARVGELEEQLEEEKETHERTVRELQERISHLEIETQTLQSRCQWLEAMLEKERQGRDSIVGNWESPQPPAQTRSESVMPTPKHLQSSPVPMPQIMRPLQPAPPRNGMPQSIPIAGPRSMTQPFSISQIVSPPEEPSEVVDLTCGGCRTNGSCACADEVLQNADLSMGCGKCSLGTRCECLEKTLEASMAAVADLKRPRPPSSPSSPSQEEKRQRSHAGVDMETDFTTMFASHANKEPMASVFPPPPPSQLQPLISIEPRDSCGFCKDGTYCVCADAMMASTVPAGPQMSEKIQTHTPPPSENDVVPMAVEVTATGAIKLPGLRDLQRSPATTNSRPPARPSGCGPNGPGTCEQCLADPKSGLFCRSLAANFEKNNNTGGSVGGCCGNGGPGGCCKTAKGPDATGFSTPSSAPIPTVVAAGVTERMSAATGGGSATPGSVLSIPCAEAYKTLASHRHFDEAADDIGSWLPKLKALPVPRPSGGNTRGYPPGSRRPPIEVEAASIMSVLKDFDVRFGRGE